MANQPPLPLVFEGDFVGENFHVTASNRQAATLIQNSLAKPLSFVLIHGGSGKTHLCKVLSERLNVPILSPKADNTVPEYTRCLVDNAEKLEDNRDLQEYWVHRINTLQAVGQGVMVMFSRTLPSEWRPENQLADFISRINGLFAHAEILPPDDELLVKMLQKLAADRQFTLTSEQITYCLMRMPRNFTAAQVLIEKIDHLSLSAQRKVSRTTVRAALDSLQDGS